MLSVSDHTSISIPAYLWQFAVDSQYIWLIATICLRSMHPDIVYTAAGDSYLFCQRVICVTHSISSGIAYVQIQVAITALIP